MLFWLAAILLRQSRSHRHSCTTASAASCHATDRPSGSGQYGFGQSHQVVDGDTIDILREGNITTRIRCASYDAPERGQPFGNNATKFLADLIAGEVINVVIVDEPDQYGRYIGDVLDDDGQRVSVKLVKAGLAWHFVRFAPNDTELAQAELSARAAENGLWSDKRFVPPWDWRKLSKAERDKLR